MNRQFRLYHNGVWVVECDLCSAPLVILEKDENVFELESFLLEESEPALCFVCEQEVKGMMEEVLGNE